MEIMELSSSETGTHCLLVKGYHGLKLIYPPTNSCVPNMANCVKVQAQPYREVFSFKTQLSTN